MIAVESTHSIVKSWWKRTKLSLDKSKVLSKPICLFSSSFELFSAHVWVRIPESLEVEQGYVLTLWIRRWGPWWLVIYLLNHTHLDLAVTSWRSPGHLHLSHFSGKKDVEVPAVRRPPVRMVSQDFNYTEENEHEQKTAWARRVSKVLWLHQVVVALATAFLLLSVKFVLSTREIEHTEYSLFMYKITICALDSVSGALPYWIKCTSVVCCLFFFSKFHKYSPLGSGQDCRQPVSVPSSSSAMSL